MSIPFENRICFTCHTLEDEAHVFFECIRYDHLRTQYISPNFDFSLDCNQVRQLANLLESESRKTINNAAIFWKKSMIIHADYAEWGATLFREFPD